MHNERDPADDHSDATSTPTRDVRGRWIKGHCPNPKGRPRKKPRWQTETDDLMIFGNTLIEIRTNGKPELMLRRVALLEKIFESAMKGKTSAQRFLFQKFEENDMRLAELRVQYEYLICHWILDNPNHRKPGYEIPRAVELEITKLRSLLGHYYPGSFKKPESE